MENLSKEELNHVISRVLKRIYKPVKVEVGVSNRHVHLSKADLETLFGEGYELTKFKDLKQPGFFAAKETVRIIGPKNVMNNVRILGPLRPETQIEISVSDSFALGIKAPIRESGKLGDTPGVMVMGPKGFVAKDEGVIIAHRHIHMPTAYAKDNGYRDGQCVKVKTTGTREVELSNVLIRTHDKVVLEAHFDMDEANACGLKNGDFVEIVRE